MSYCDKWALVGLAIGYSPLMISMVATVVVARLPGRLWLALVLAVPCFLLPILIGRPFTLILWNGIRPAVC